MCFISTVSSLGRSGFSRVEENMYDSFDKYRATFVTKKKSIRTWN